MGQIYRLGGRQATLGVIWGRFRDATIINKFTGDDDDNAKNTHTHIHRVNKLITHHPIAAHA